jgi:hypothetical protein
MLVQLTTEPCVHHTTLRVMYNKAISNLYCACTRLSQLLQIAHHNDRCTATTCLNRVIEPGSYAALALVAGELNEQRRTQATATTAAEGATAAGTSAAATGGKEQQQEATTEAPQAPAFTV